MPDFALKSLFYLGYIQLHFYFSIGRHIQTHLSSFQTSKPKVLHRLDHSSVPGSSIVPFGYYCPSLDAPVPVLY